MERFTVVVVGGGNAGLSVAGRLRRAGVRQVAVVEPRTTHVFAPMQSHIAGGVARASEATRSQAAVMPRGVAWIRDRVVGVSPEAHTITLRSGRELGYDQLVVCPGLSRDWDAIPGLAEAMRTPAGVSSYELELAAKASPALRDLTTGTVVFVEAPQPASCANAAQKPMYLACAWWRSRGVLGDIRVVLVRPGPTMFGIAEIDAELDRKVAEYGIEVHHDSELVSVDPAVRSVTVAGPRGTETIAYDVLHAVPPQSAPGWIAASELASTTDEPGFVDIDPETLRHVRHPDVWALGDAAATHSYRSGGAIRPQAKVLVRNLVAARAGRDLPARYDGYGVCPITVSRRTVVFAEFDRAGDLEPTVPFWRSLYRERRLSWLFDRRILPWVYWNLILRGRA